MNGENYTPYFYNYSQNQSQNPSWNNWNYQQPSYMQQNFSRAPPNHNLPPPTHVRPPAFHKAQTQNNTNRPPYFRNNRYPRGNQYPANGPPGPPPLRYPNPNNMYNKRPRSDVEPSEPHVKISKKKKKSLSQNVPRRDWTLAEAGIALAIEKELNRKSKLSLIIKFPDQELNKEIVTHLNPAIESVHFQQPCTPRFCYVTLQDSADAEEVIRELNKQKFGSGCITAEYKRDREEDLVVNAEDIDPLTLYVGNLAQEVTKEDVQLMFPTHKRMDIGFAKKMKFTRYAFVVFRSVKDSLDAFRSAHNKELRSKSLIVRFRRLHGTVGMPGEAKLQNAPKGKDDVVDNVASIVSPSDCLSACKEPASSEDINQPEGSSLVDIMEMIPNARIPSVGLSTSSTNENISTTIKREQLSPEKELLCDVNKSGKEDDDELSFDYALECDKKRIIKEEDVKPVIIKKEILEEDSPESYQGNSPEHSPRNSQENVGIKREAESDNLGEDIDWSSVFHQNEEGGEEEETTVCVTDFDSLYENMVYQANQVNYHFKNK